MSAILNTYNRKKIAFTKGKGAFLYSTSGKKYLDFVNFNIKIEVFNTINIFNFSF